MEDQEIIRLLNEDPDKGIHEAIQIYGGAVETICRNFLYDCSDMDIEEAVADTFFKLWKARKRIECRTSQGMKSYIYEIARNTARDRRKKITRVPFYSLEEVEILLDHGEQSNIYKSQGSDSSTSGRYEPEREYARKVRKNEVKRCLGELGEPDHSIFVMRYFYGMKIKEIALRTNMETKKVENLLFRGKEKLAKVLKERGIVSYED